MREESWIQRASRWKYIKHYGTTIGLGELHICHRGLGKTRHVATWSVVSVCLWRKCRRHEGAEGLMCWRLEVRGSNQSNKQHWMKPWSDWWGIGKRKKGKMKGRKRKRGRQMFECIFLFHHTFQHQVFFLSTLVFISTSIQTRTQIPSPLEFFQ